MGLNSSVLIGFYGFLWFIRVYIDIIYVLIEFIGVFCFGDFYSVSCLFHEFVDVFVQFITVLVESIPLCVELIHCLVEFLVLLVENMFPFLFSRYV